MNIAKRGAMMEVVTKLPLDIRMYYKIIIEKSW